MTDRQETLREALESIRDICKPMSMSMTGPVWFDGGTPAGGGSRERIWRIADAAVRGDAGLSYTDGFEAGRQSAAANVRALVIEATKPNGHRLDAYWLDEAVRAIFDLDGAVARLSQPDMETGS
jgi:hypothetical protein